MTRNWLRSNKPGATTDAQIQGQFLYWFLQFVCGFTVLDKSNTSHWTSLFSGTQGRFGAGSHVFQPQDAGYSFTLADVGRYIAIRDGISPTFTGPNNTKNNGIYKIVSINNAHSVNLETPLTSFASTSHAAAWTLFDVTSKPPLDAWFVIQSANTSQAWQALIVVNNSLFTNPGVNFQLGAWGGWDVTTHAWLLPASLPINLNNTVTKTFCVADAQLGSLFVWAEGATATDRVGVFCGAIAGLHAAQGVSVPTDSAPVALLGDNTLGVNTLGRSPTSGFAINGQISLPDQSGYAASFLHQWLRVDDGVDFFTVMGIADPRSGTSDSYPFLVFQRSPVVALRGTVPLLRLVSDAQLNRTLINSNGIYIIGSGLGVEWDGSTPTAL